MSYASPLVLETKHLCKSFATRKGGHAVRALDDVSIELARGEVLGIVGESGCGKSTLGRVVLQLLPADSGSVHYEGQDLAALDRDRMGALRQELQIIFQDPYSALNPRQRIGAALSEPLKVHTKLPAAQIRARVQQILDEVGLPGSAYDRFPHEFSGGQRQRIVIARALILEPRLVVADEAVSALDVSVRAQILAVLHEIKKRRDLTILFISHDLGVVRHFCDRVAVMYLGRIVEIGPVKQVLDDPLHPYTKMLRAASPVPEISATPQAPVLIGEVPSPLDPPLGCHFHPRCAFRHEPCERSRPQELKDASGRTVSCHLYDAKPAERLMSMLSVG